MAESLVYFKSLEKFYRLLKKAKMYDKNYFGNLNRPDFFIKLSMGEKT